VKTIPLLFSRNFYQQLVTKFGMELSPHQCLPVVFYYIAKRKKRSEETQTLHTG